MFLWLPGPSSCVRRVLPQQCHRVIGLVRTYTTFFWPQVLLILFASPALLAAGTFAFVPLTRPSGRRCFCFCFPQTNHHGRRSFLLPLAAGASLFADRTKYVCRRLFPDSAVMHHNRASIHIDLILSSVAVLAQTIVLLGRHSSRPPYFSACVIHHVARSAIGIHHVAPAHRAGTGLSHLLLDGLLDHL